MHILSFILKTGSYYTAISLVGIKLTCLPHSLVLGSKHVPSHLAAIHIFTQFGFTILIKWVKIGSGLWLLFANC